MLLNFFKLNFFEYVPTLEFLCFYLCFLLLVTKLSLSDVYRVMMYLIISIFLNTAIKQMINIPLSTEVPLCFHGTEQDWLMVIKKTSAFPSGHTVYYTSLLFSSLLFLYKKYFKNSTIKSLNLHKKVTIYGSIFVISSFMLILTIRIRYCRFHSIFDIMGGLIFSILMIYILDKLYYYKKIKRIFFLLLFIFTIFIIFYNNISLLHSLFDKSKDFSKDVLSKKQTLLYLFFTPSAFIYELWKTLKDK